MDEDKDMQVAAFEAATGVKVRNQEAFFSWFRGMQACCAESEDDDEMESEDTGSKSAPSIAEALGKKGK